jgi:hypothetical protein
MSQLVSTLKFLHDQHFFFPCYELTEHRIFLNQTCSMIYIDPGYLKIEEKSKIQIWNDLSRENSEKIDVHALGIIFYRLCTLKVYIMN